TDSHPIRSASWSSRAARLHGKRNISAIHLKQVLGERVGSNRWKRSRAFGRNRANYGKLFVPDRLPNVDAAPRFVLSVSGFSGLLSQLPGGELLDATTPRCMSA